MSTPSGRRVRDIDPARLAALNEGVVEAATLTEILAIDLVKLMESAKPQIDVTAIARMRAVSAIGIVGRMRTAGEIVLDTLGPDGVMNLYEHPSDTVRGWAAFAVGAHKDLLLGARLAAIRPAADDPHFGVREWAWLSARPHLAVDLGDAVERLSAWSVDPSDRIRRFSSEAIRPRGVWCAHISRLKSDPDMALPVIERLRADPVPYVQDSVGNWLNDAAKSRPDWVRDLCDRWRTESAGPATARICKRGLRSLPPS